MRQQNRGGVKRDDGRKAAIDVDNRFTWEVRGVGLRNLPQGEPL